MIQIVFAHGHTENLSDAPFGHQQALPWGHCKQDLEFFKEITQHTVLVMGANTFASLPFKLPGRKHMVLSENAHHPHFQSPTTKNGELPDLLADCLEDALRFNWKYSIIGGPGVIKEGLEFADVVYKTTIVEDNLPYDVSIDVTNIEEQFPIKENVKVLTDQVGRSVFIDKLTRY
ncbi:dihydrofolate reductase [Vibrio phage D479]